MTISESKKALRKGILAKRRNLSEAYQKQAAQEIYEKLRALAVYKEASVLCLYVPIQKEVDLFQYIPNSERMESKSICRVSTGIPWIFTHIMNRLRLSRAHIIY